MYTSVFIQERNDDHFYNLLQWWHDFQGDKNEKRE
jgi:hypothetical protein